MVLNDNVYCLIYILNIVYLIIVCHFHIFHILVNDIFIKKIKIMIIKMIIFSIQFNIIINFDIHFNLNLK